MGWFKKITSGLKSQKPKDFPDGLWLKCEACDEIIYRKELEKRLGVCPICGYHFKIPALKYIELIADESTFMEFDSELVSADPLNFKDSKKYPDRIKQALKKTGRKSAIICGNCNISGNSMVLCVMDFGFIGGSMGSVVGEKVARSIEKAIELNTPLIIVSASGGARMQEGILSLMQMAKTSVLLARLADNKIPYISVLTNPTTAGVMASYASLGDVIIAEPKALLGFAGPRVIKQTIGGDLPEGFQTSEFVLEHGFIDCIVPRESLKSTISRILSLLTCSVK